MNNYFRSIRSARIEPQSDYDDPWPDNLIELPLTRAQQRRFFPPSKLWWAVIAAGFAVLVFLYVRGGVMDDRIGPFIGFLMMGAAIIGLATATSVEADHINSLEARAVKAQCAARDDLGNFYWTKS